MQRVAVCVLCRAAYILIHFVLFLLIPSCASRLTLSPCNSFICPYMNTHIHALRQTPAPSPWLPSHSLSPTMMLRKCTFLIGQTTDASSCRIFFTSLQSSFPCPRERNRRRTQTVHCLVPLMKLSIINEQQTYLSGFLRAVLTSTTKPHRKAEKRKISSS